MDDWSTGKCMDMAGLFCNAEMFNQPLDGWDTSRVMYGPFCACME